MAGGGTSSTHIRTSLWYRSLGLAAGAALLLGACGSSGAGSSGASERSSGADVTTTDGGVTTTGLAAARTGMVACADLHPTGWSASLSDADLPFQVGAGEAPGLPGGASGPPDSAAVFKTADEFLAQSNVPDPAARKQVMDAAGYRGGIEAEWIQDPQYTMQVLSFADASSAADYVTARLPSICGQGGTQAGVTMLENGDGIMWADPLGATHGEFILGGSQVSLTSCGDCEPVSLDEMQAWHDAFVDAYATGPAVPIG